MTLSWRTLKLPSDSDFHYLFKMSKRLIQSSTVSLIKRSKKLVAESWLESVIKKLISLLVSSYSWSLVIPVPHLPQIYALELPSSISQSLHPLFKISAWISTSRMKEKKLIRRDTIYWSFKENAKLNSENWKTLFLTHWINQRAIFSIIILLLTLWRPLRKKLPLSLQNSRRLKIQWRRSNLYQTNISHCQTWHLESSSP